MKKYEEIKDNNKCLTALCLVQILLHDILWVENFNPIAIRVLNKSQSMHLPLIRFLDELHPHRFKPLTRLINVGDNNADMTKSSRVLVSIVVVEIRIVFGAPIMCQFDGRMGAHRVHTSLLLTLRNLGCILVTHEEKRKLAMWKVKLFEKLHTQDVAVKRQTLARVFDAEHCLLKVKVFGLRRRFADQSS